MPYKYLEEIGTAAIAFEPPNGRQILSQVQAPHLRTELKLNVRPLPRGQDLAQISQFFVHVFGFKHRIAHDFA